MRVFADAAGCRPTHVLGRAPAYDLQPRLDGGRLVRTWTRLRPGPFEDERVEAMAITRVTVDEVRTRLDRGEPLVFVDARNAEAWSKAQTQIPDSIGVPDEVAGHVESVPRGRAIITYCT